MKFALNHPLVNAQFFNPSNLIRPATPNIHTTTFSARHPTSLVLQSPAIRICLHHLNNLCNVIDLLLDLINLDVRLRRKLLIICTALGYFLEIWCDVEFQFAYFEGYLIFEVSFEILKFILLPSNNSR